MLFACNMNDYPILQVRSFADENSFNIPPKTVLKNVVDRGPVLTLPITAAFRAIKPSLAISGKMP
jgi:hypothetical protein